MAAYTAHDLLDIVQKQVNSLTTVLEKDSEQEVQTAGVCDMVDQILNAVAERYPDDLIVKAIPRFAPSFSADDQAPRLIESS